MHIVKIQDNYSRDTVTVFLDNGGILEVDRHTYMSMSQNDLLRLMQKQMGYPPPPPSPSVASSSGTYATNFVSVNPTSLSSANWVYDTGAVMDSPNPVKELPKPKVFELSKLDALVISDTVKTEILAVLKQHKYADKLFKEWGLGDTIEYGKGMSFLFWGKPGTGKTWAASCISKVFGAELLTLSAAEIQTSEPGGANRNIQNAFKEAKKSHKVLFLDECDSLITSRSDVGMILGGEINTLLTEIEKFEGVCILATNRIDTLDEALERRIALIVEFPEPTFAERKIIWEKLLPKKMPLEKEVTPEKLAEHKLTGGQIKNVVLQAARLAVAADQSNVTLTNFIAAVERVHKSKELMGKRPQHNQIRVHQDIIKSQ